MGKAYDTLLKSNFINKIVYQRLQWKHRIDDCTVEEIYKLMKGFFKMIAEHDFEKEFFKYEPISLLSFKNMAKTLIVYMIDEGLIEKDTPPEDIDMNYIEALTESLIYGERMYICCTYFEHDKSIMTVKDMPRVLRHAFYNIGYTTMLDLALIYCNTTNPKNLPGIGPEKYRKFQEYMALDCNEFEVYEKKATY